ncbi:kynurenine formamidase-like [Montipora capricornis]|uniref:kynurenine formamidase-like n=1 Tax=Montipora capricornis TaxID=246305 RepID=UPI0035F1F887
MMEARSREWYDLQYTPSKWCKRMPTDEVVPYHVKLCQERSKITRQNLNEKQAELDVPYGPDGAKMDIFYPKKADQENSPVVVFVHGGLWQEGNKEMHGFVSNSWVNAGFIAAIVGYNLAPEASMDDMVTEIQASVEFLAKKFPESKLFLCGHSAGAHLCAMTAVRSWYDSSSVPQAIHGVCLLSGIFDLTPLLNTHANDAVKLDESSAARYSPLLILKQAVPRTSCPTLVAVEEYGSPEFIRQSKVFAEALENHGVQCIFLQVPGVDHFNLIEEMFNSDHSISKEIVKLVHGES